MDACEPAAEARAMDLRKKYGIDAAMLTPVGRATVRKDKKKAQRERDQEPVAVVLEEAPPEPQANPVTILNKMAVLQLERLKDGGVDLLHLLDDHGDFVNPVPGVPTFLRIALHKLQGGAIFTPLLANQYQQELDWSEKKARTHAEIASRMLMRAGCAERDRRTTDRIILRRY